MTLKKICFELEHSIFRSKTKNVFSYLDRIVLSSLIKKVNSLISIKSLKKRHDRVIKIIESIFHIYVPYSIGNMS